MYLVTLKSTSLNLRISPELRATIEQLAEYHGLSMSSYAHSILVKAIREQLRENPEISSKREIRFVPVEKSDEKKKRKTG